jgi:uncharacterized protein DUF4271
MSHLLKIKKVLFCCLLTLSAMLQAGAQPPANPFDLLPRVVQTGSQDSSALTGNPFDILSERHVALRATQSPGFTVEKKREPLTAKQKEENYNQFVLFSILAMFIFLTLVYTVFRILIEKIWKAFLNDNLLNQLLRERAAGVTVAYLLLYLMFCFNGGLFLFLLCRYFGIEISSSNGWALTLCVAGLAGFFVLKHLLLQIVGGIFPVKKEIVSYNFTIVIFNLVAGFFLVPVILFVAYVPAAMTHYALYAGLGLLLLTYLFRNLRGLFIANRFLARHKFHFFLYLCAVEIAPFLLVVKLLLQQQGT